MVEGCCILILQIHLLLRRINTPTIGIFLFFLNLTPTIFEDMVLNLFCVKDDRLISINPLHFVGATVQIIRILDRIVPLVSFTKVLLGGEGVHGFLLLNEHVLS